MKIAFFYECGKIDEIGTGHKYRSREIGKTLEKNGHDIEYIDQKNVAMNKNWDVLVIDHMTSQAEIIQKAKRSGTKVVLIDGSLDDVDMVDLSISSFVNPKAQYRGIKYTVFPACREWVKYRPYMSSKTIFIGVGGFDAGNIAEFILNILDEMSINAIVAKSINHRDFREDFSRVEMFDEENYYDAMHECAIGITNGGLTLFQALHYGLPSIAIPQYKHQQINIDYVQHCCLPSKRDKKDIMNKIEWLMGNEYYRKSLSMLAMHHVDGKGTKRICSLIEGLRN